MKGDRKGLTHLPGTVLPSGAASMCLIQRKAGEGEMEEQDGRASCR